MNAAPIPEDSDDQLESVAERLLGVDFTTPADFADPLDLDDDDLFGDELVDEPEFAAELPADAAEAELPVVDATLETKDDFGLGLEESADAEAPLRRGPSAPRARDDRYWDALEGWDWDEGTGTTERTVEPPTAEPAPVPPSTPEFSSPAATRKTAEFREDDDFGAGLADESTTTPARPLPGSRGDRPSERKPLPERTPERESEGRRTRSGERDEGRRSDRSGRRDAGSGGRGRRGRDEDRPRREPPPTPPRVPEPEAVVDEVVDFDTELSEFGSGLDVAPQPREATEPERGPRRGRRRRGRGRGRDRAEPAAQDLGPAPVESGTRELDYGPEHEFEPVDDLSEPRESDQPEEFDIEPAPIDEAPVEDAEPQYGDVPTWAEAISYLFNPKVRSSSRSADEGTRGGEGESSGGPRRSSGGERGRRGGSRRGGGRGRRSSGTSD
jgi:hypothetical protein